MVTVMRVRKARGRDCVSVRHVVGVVFIRKTRGRGCVCP